MARRMPAESTPARSLTVPEDYLGGRTCDVEHNVELAGLTTLGLGGPARTLVSVYDARQTVEAVREVGEHDEPLLILAGGSNVVVSDAGFSGTVVLLRSTGVAVVTDGAEHALVRVAAGHALDDLVQWCVAESLAGVECLSGIPGSVGATPIQNVGAYGQEIAEVLRAVTVYDRKLDRVVELSAAECGFAYRTSTFKRAQRYVVLEVVLRLRRDQAGGPLRYGELSRRLATTEQSRPPLVEVRAAVLELRRDKGMVIDVTDPDTRSVGSFFTNPIVSAEQYRQLDATLGATAEQIPHWLTGDGRVKLAAAWLIEHAGFGKGFTRGGVGVSSRHTLALVNRGGSTTELLGFAQEISCEVQRRYGVKLEHEPVLVG